ncbi:hypothetical protein GCM10020219_103950 [Nonomuraea dietziae]
MLFPQLADVILEQVVAEQQVIRVHARTRSVAASCPACGVLTRRVHAYHMRRLADVPVGSRTVVVDLRIRRLVCEARGCMQQTFREQVPQVAARYARRTVGLAALIVDLAVVLAGRRAGAAVLSRLPVTVSRTTVLRLLMSVPAPAGPVPAVLSVDDFALRRGNRYATLLIDAVTHRRIDVLPDRKSSTLITWLREHPGVQVVCRDGSAAYAEAIRQGAPDAVQVSDRWHLWNGLAAAVEKTVVTHSRCWHTAGPRRAGALAERTRRKHAQVHTLLEQGLGLGECARRLGWGFNTVKRYARAASADDLLRPPKYGATLVDPYREHLRRRLVEEPGVPVTHLLAEIRERGYTGSANLLVRYLNQGRADPRSDSALTTPAGLLAHEPPRRSTCSPPSAPGRADSRLPAPDSPGLAGAGVRRHPHPASRSRP